MLKSTRAKTRKVTNIHVVALYAVVAAVATAVSAVVSAPLPTSLSSHAPPLKLCQRLRAETSFFSKLSERVEILTFTVHIYIVYCIMYTVCTLNRVQDNF